MPKANLGQKCVNMRSEREESSAQRNTLRSFVKRRMIRTSTSVTSLR